MSIKIEVEVKDVTAGVPTIIFYEGNYYDIRKKTEPKKTEPNPEPFVFSSIPDKGKQIGEIGKMPIYENILSCVREAINNKTSPTKAVANFYPKLRKSTHGTYAWTYNKWIEKHGNTIEENVDVTLGKCVGKYNTANIYQNVLDTIEKTEKEKLSKEEQTAIIGKFYPGRKKSTHGYYLYAHQQYIIKNRRVSTENLNPDKGKLLARINHTTFFENIYNDLLPLMERNAPVSESFEIFKKYKYMGTTASLESYYKNYIKYYRKINNLPKVAYERRQYKKRTPSVVHVKKYRKRKPKDAHGRSDKYHMFIKNEWYLAVKRAVHKFGFVATTKSIAKETGLQKQQVGATLDYLKQRCEIYMTRSGYHNRIPVYHPAITGKEDV